MKKFILLALVTMFTLGAAAQVRTSRTFTRQKSNTMWYVRAGMNISTPPGSIGDVDYGDCYLIDGKVGFDVDFGFQKAISSSNAYWGMELGIGSRGVKLQDEERDYDSFSSVAYGVTYSPITLGYKFPLTESIKLDGHLGGFISYDFAYGGDADLDEAFDAGIQVGVGAWFNRFNLDLTYQAGFCNAIEYNNDNCKIGKFMIRVGYAF